MPRSPGPGFALPAEVLERDWSETYQPNEAVEEEQYENSEPVEVEGQDVLLLLHHGMSLNPHFPWSINHGTCGLADIPWWNVSGSRTPGAA